MTELLRFVTSDFFTFCGSFLFMAMLLLLLCGGWALNALALGLRGIHCEHPIDRSP